MAKWEVFHNYLPGLDREYQVGRKLREDEPLHGGNIEYSGGLMTREEAEALAERLNNAQTEGGSNGL